MERLTQKNWRNLDPWECCGQDNYCQRGCHEAGGCNNGCIVPKNYRRLAKYEDIGLTPEQIVEKETTLNGTYISMEAHNREVKKLKAEIGYEQDRIDCRNSICNANREGMYRKCAELESQVEAQQQEIAQLKGDLSDKDLEIAVLCDRIHALTADKDEQAGQIMRMEDGFKKLKKSFQWLSKKIRDLDIKAWAEDKIDAINALLGGKEDV